MQILQGYNRSGKSLSQHNNESEVIMSKYTHISRNTYYKQGENISGIALDEIVTNRIFIDCDFHPICKTVTFQNCIFIHCDIWKDTTNMQNCTFHDCF
jgi:hypothetical protein